MTLLRPFVLLLLLVFTAFAGPASAQEDEPPNLDISARCERGMAIFEIVNRGETWPTTGWFFIYRLDNGKPISQRRMLLVAGQKVSFRVKSEIATAAEVGLFVSPEWLERKVVLDSRIRCE